MKTQQSIQIGGVYVLNLDSKETTSNMVDLLRVQRNRFTATIESCPSVLQRMEMIRKLGLATWVITADQISPRFNKQGDDRDGTKTYKPQSQVDQMLSINDEDQDQKT